MIIVDTSIWVDFFRDRNSAGSRTLHRLIEQEEDLALADIILTEILQGIKEEKVFRRIRDCLLDFPIYKPRGIETYLGAAQIYRDCRKMGRTVGKTIDCIIAAICLENDLTILHRDSDFDSMAVCAGLKVLPI